MRVRIRFIGAVALFCLLLALAVVAFAVRTPAIITDSDFAVTELYVELATRGELLAGPYSRFGWHHPGPLYFYVIAPLYALSGDRAAVLYAAAAAINFVAITAMAFVLARESRLVTASVVLACAAFAFRVPRFLASPWTAHVPVLPSLTFLTFAAAVMNGRITLMPGMIVFGSFAAQTHVGFAPLVLLVAAAAIVTAMSDRAARPALRRSIIASAGLGLLLWLPSILESIRNQGENPASLWRFFVTDADAGHSVSEALRNGSYGLMALFRPDFDLPWGGHFGLDYLSWCLVGAATETVLLVVVGWWHITHQRRFEAYLAFIALAATLITVLGLMRIRGDILNHDLFRVAAIGVFNAGVLGAAGVRASAAAARVRQMPASISVMVVVIAVAFVSILSVRDIDSLTAYERRQRSRQAIVAAHAAVRDYLQRNGLRKPLLQIGNDRWGDAAGVMLRLVQDETPVAVKDAQSMFTDRFTAVGDEDVLITLADLELHRALRGAPGNTVLLEAFPLFVDASRLGR
ncbi:MAG: hypothetical protein ACM4AI_03135 [Acidobacteriota bacterium]